MSFTISDFNDLKQLLATHPDWRVELRHLLLSEDFEALPRIVRELAEAQRRTEQRLAELVEAQRGLEQRVARLEEAVARLAESQFRFEQRMEGFEKRMDRFEAKLGRVEGYTLEIHYRLNAASYFGAWLRRTQMVDGNELAERAEGQLSEDELRELLLTDMVVRGRLARHPARPEAWLAVEISSMVDGNDVARAVRRAELLRRAGLPALPVAAGENATVNAVDEGRQRGVAILQDGRSLFWEEALAAWPV